MTIRFLCTALSATLLIGACTGGGGQAAAP
jgi:hypothetical protein